MISPLRESNSIKVGIDGQELLSDKLFSLKNDSYFRKLSDFVRLYTLAYQHLNNSNVDIKIKEIAKRIICLVTKLSKLEVSASLTEFESVTKFIADINSFKESLLVEDNLEEVDYCWVDAERKTISDTEFEYIVSDSSFKKYKGYPIIIVENYTNDVDLNAFLSMRDALQQVNKVSEDIKGNSLGYKFEFTSFNHNRDILYAINVLLSAFEYLSNCTSIRTGRLEDYDEIRLETDIQSAVAFALHVSVFLDARLKYFDSIDA